jgi:ABC-type antimicrobial peptide transport system permease subunit
MNMIQLKQYLQSVRYSILHDKGYALFCVGGTALTFIFIVLILQLIHIFAGNYPPMTSADRIIRLEYFQDTKGKEIWGIRNTEINAFSEALKKEGFDCVSLYHQNAINVLANGYSHTSGTGFVSADFWKMYTFKFLYGKPFSKEDIINRKPAAVLTEATSRSYFNTANSVGKKITFQGNEYEVAGTVENVSMFSTPADVCSVWVPYVFNKFIPNGSYSYTVDVLVPPAMPVSSARESISGVVNYYFEHRNIKMDFPPQKVKTMKESMTAEEGKMFQYGGITALFLFLLIPALNILSLGNAHTNNRAEEIAIRRTFGAGRLSSFLQIMMENLLLTVAGSVIGLLLAIPAVSMIQQTVMGDSVFGDISLVRHIDCAVILTGVLPAMLVFSLLSGGLPAYLISKRNITHVLKGGSK